MPNFNKAHHFSLFSSLSVSKPLGKAVKVVFPSDFRAATLTAKSFSERTLLYSVILLAKEALRFCDSLNLEGTAYPLLLRSRCYASQPCL